MRELTNREKDLSEALSGTAKSALSLIPVLGQAIAGWDAYKRSAFDRNVIQLIKHLSDKVEDLNAFFNEEYFNSEEGQLFIRKVIDAALDTQLEDKQELFVNTLVNAPSSTQLDELHKLKFIDMLRHLSRAALIILAEIHNLFSDQVRGPGRKPDQSKPFPAVDPIRIAEELSNKYEPYLITSAINELESQGLFSTTGDWRKGPDGRYLSSGGFATALCYTNLAFNFVEFITVKSNLKQVK